MSESTANRLENRLVTIEKRIQAIEEGNHLASLENRVRVIEKQLEKLPDQVIDSLGPTLSKILEKLDEQRKWAIYAFVYTIAIATIAIGLSIAGISKADEWNWLLPTIVGLIVILVTPFVFSFWLRQKGR
jgi:hypothetical protein